MLCENCIDGDARCDAVLRLSVLGRGKLDTGNADALRTGVAGTSLGEERLVVRWRDANVVPRTLMEGDIMGPETDRLLDATELRLDVRLVAPLELEMARLGVCIGGGGIRWDLPGGASDRLEYP